MNEMCINREEVEKIVKGELATTSAVIDGQFNLITEKLATIAKVGERTLEQATKTNGRVTELEKEVTKVVDDMSHPEVSCPFKEIIKTLQNTALKNDIVVATIWKVGVFIAGVITLTLAVATFFLKNS